MELSDLIDITEKERQAQPPVQIRCCIAAGCVSSNSPAVLETLQQAVRAAGLEKRVGVVGVGCLRLCCQGPLVLVDGSLAPLTPAPSPPTGGRGEQTSHPSPLMGDQNSQPSPLAGEQNSLPSPLASEQNSLPSPLRGEGPGVRGPASVLYQKVTPENAPSVVAGLNGGKVTAERADLSSPFFALQSSVVLENSGRIEPERIETYIAADGYRGLLRALRDLTPEQVVEIITKSGLRGRGGAGYPTGVKWATVAKNRAERKYVVCNADEGDPGAFMNRSVLESDPHRVLEGMAIAGYAVGANQGYIYVRGEYPLAIERLQKAIKQAGRLGLLGTHIFSSPFDFRIDIRIGAGAFVCGEETALMSSIMGMRGTPTPRPPFPAERGLWGMPTLLNNVETFANVPSILRRGPEWFASMGTPKSPGTKVFCITGKVVNTGLVEVPLGTPIRKIVEDIGGGAPAGGKVKAVQTGGPSGGCIPAELLDTPADYESLGKVGSIMGSGGMIVMDQTTDMVDVARYFMEFCMDESCGKCIPCRAGTVQLHRLLQRILQGSAGAEDIQRLETLCDMVKNTSLCGLGQTAPNPTLSTLRYFRKEYESRLATGNRAQRLGLPVMTAVQK